MNKAYSKKWCDLIYTVGRNLSSKRTWVLVIGSVALWDGLITEASWMILAGAYLGDKIALGIIAQRSSVHEQRQEQNESICDR